ncbi:hypothetical protein ACOSQ2_014140 [Xanthoceras sorbifolium]|uniref:F-box domain-containing protein n=1 Tax=Xanthoceras sorbifolium TaxID=99658 RepID=A0ABQ8I4W0_9ROSI|nr:hypothetical protein JRO89_XS04G0045100 [Xanthoceras sorbifolium]
MERQRHRKSVDGDHDDEATAAANTGMIELPEVCLATVISFTSPRDACRLSCVNSLFKLATESDAVWDRFLPADYRSLISNSNFCSSSSSMSKKELYLGLCHNPILIDEGKMSFQLDKLSGKKCYMISARKLAIVWGNTPAYWRWISVRGSRFPEVAELIHVWWLEIRGEINTSILSPRTTYGAYLVFKMVVVAYGFVNQAVEVSFGLVGSESHKRAVYLDMDRGQRPRQIQFARRNRIDNRSRSLEWQGSVPRENGGHYPKKRGDGWLEIELGEIFIGVGEKNVLEMSVMEVTSGNWKAGLIVQGIEIRPKHSK